METKRYKVGPEQGYRQETILKLTDDHAKKLGLGPDQVVDVSTTADSQAKVDAYEEAITRQDAARAEQAKADAAESKKRGAPKAADAE
jgi:hypothetical protein